MEKEEERYREQTDTQKEQMYKQKEQKEVQRIEFAKQMDALINRLGNGSPAPAALAASVPSFAPFDPTSQIWRDYLARFHTFVGANSIPKEKTPQVFLTKDTTNIYKLLCTMAREQRPTRNINMLYMEDITEFMQK